MAAGLGRDFTVMKALKKDGHFKGFSIAVIAVWMCVFTLIPFASMLTISFLTPGAHQFFHWQFTLNNYWLAIQLAYLTVFLRSIFWAATTTALCLLIGFPFAYCVAKAPKRLRLFLLLLIIIPFWTSSLIRTYAVMTVIKTNGLLNQFLLAWHLIKTPLHLLYTPLAVQIGLIYALLPFMILPLFANLEKFNWTLTEAAKDLGAGKWKTFWTIVVPLSIPGIISGCLLVFLPAMTLFYLPNILGGARSFLLGNLIKFEFLTGHNWPLGAAISVFLCLFVAVLILAYGLKKQRGKNT
jgi:spermidine/putrescine transport system permease protein